MSSDLDDESALWAASLRGNSAAFARLYDMHSARVYRHTARLLGSHEDAEDATAAAFLELWRLRARVTVVEDSTLPWLLVTATNVSRNLARSRRRYKAVLDRLPRHQAVDDETQALAAGRLDAQRALAPAAARIRSLSDVDHALLVLTAVEGIPVATAAAALGLSSGVARTRLHRIKSRLRAEVVASGLEVSDEFRS